MYVRIVSTYVRVVLPESSADSETVEPLKVHDPVAPTSAGSRGEHLVTIVGNVAVVVTEGAGTVTQCPRRHVTEGVGANTQYPRRHVLEGVGTVTQCPHRHVTEGTDTATQCLRRLRTCVDSETEVH